MIRRQQPGDSTLNQLGMVSLMVSLIMMIVISLVVLGFAQVSRRNARETTDRQLSSQAYYAAESGINDALTAIKAGKITDLDTNANYATQCSGPGSFIEKLQSTTTGLKTTKASDGSQTDGISSTVDANTNTSYSCLLVNNKPSTLKVQVADSKSQVVPINFPGTLGTLNFNWRATSGGTLAGCPASASGSVFTPTTSWNAPAGCSYGVLRVDLVDLSGVTGFNTDLANRTISLFIVPTTSASVTPTDVNFATGAQQTYVVPASCNTSTGCTGIIQVAGGSKTYSARMNGIYKDLGTVSLSAKTDTGTTETFQDAELVIDATGRAQDVVKRVQVLVRLTGTAGLEPIPAAAIQGTTGVCKRFTTFGQPTSTANPDYNSASPLCAP